MLDSSNYHFWASSMKRALRIKNKLGFIDGSICEPTDIDSSLIEHWLRLDIKASTSYAETAHQLWLELEQRAQQNAPRIYEVKQSIAGLLQGPDNTVVSNQEIDWIMKFLMGLNDSYKLLKAQILLIKPFQIE
ncbi:uncharacterized protein LOC111378098 [Olea europaea var. sylvestris]|uniref:uncharacterized protein LOC111378098 n=1 Tax=Olea europaea var. sylvestris TaxID=158386 RepID=UPI000C1D729F|nr:uncharacterized protein LOC111378098 [Olea europaea var. sylvestris]